MSMLFASGGAGRGFAPDGVVGPASEPSEARVARGEAEPRSGRKRPSEDPIFGAGISPA